jgi:dTDP-glucose pyrophosphorylase
MENLEQILIQPGASVWEAIEAVDRSGAGIALLVDEDCHLIGTITDGDVRRAILHGVSMDVAAAALLDYRPEEYRRPTVAPLGTERPEILQLMQSRGIRHVPVLDDEGRVVDLVWLNELVKECELPLRAVVMAGGHGTRLRPLTEELPKPMLPMGDRPLLELIIEQLRQAGIRQVSLTTHYKEEAIVQHFGDGQDFGVEIRYVREDQPLGTAGALSLLDESAEPLLVINGDILTRLDLRAMLDFHREQQAEMTVAVRRYEFSVPYGVVETEGTAVVGISEKPTIRHFVNAGIYLLNPEVCRYIPDGQHYDMPDLISRLVTEGHRVVSFPVREYWLDIGRIEDYQKALADIENGEI